METKVVNRSCRVFLVTVLFLFGMLLVPSAKAGILCGQPYELIRDEPGPVEIGCVTGDVYVFNGTANLVAGGEVTSLMGLGECSINIYGGTIAPGYPTTYGLNLVSLATVTVYAASAEVDAATITDGQSVTPNDSDWLEITDSYIKNIRSSTVWFDLIGTYQDLTPFVIPCALETGAILSLNVPQALPEIEVLPAMGFWDFGDVEVGQSTTYVVQIFNYGTAELNVSSVTLTGDAAFTFTSGPVAPMVIAPNTSIGVDFEVTFAPTVAGTASAVVQVASDDGDEALVEVSLVGVGIATEEPLSQQIQDVLDYFDASAALGTLQGYGPGNSPNNRLKALRNMIEAAGDLINAGAYEQAADQLQAISKKTDGAAKPQDFVTGEAVAELNAKIKALIADLTL